MAWSDIILHHDVAVWCHAAAMVCQSSRSQQKLCRRFIHDCGPPVSNGTPLWQSAVYHSGHPEGGSSGVSIRGEKSNLKGSKNSFGAVPQKVWVETLNSSLGFVGIEKNLKLLNVHNISVQVCVSVRSCACACVCTHIHVYLYVEKSLVVVKQRTNIKTCKLVAATLPLISVCFFPWRHLCS
jgi:hypothetical protein